MAEENEKKTTGDPEAGPAEEPLIDETIVSSRPGWREIFRQAFDKARREHQVTNRRELGRDRSRSLFLLAGAAIAVLLLFLGVFSSSNTKKTTSPRPLGTPDLGRRATQVQQRSGQSGSVTPLLNAQTSPAEIAPEQDVTPEEIGRTARLTQSVIPSTPTPVINPGTPGRYALGRISFSDTAQREQGPVPPKATVETTSDDDLRKPALVFVRSTQTNAPVSVPRDAATAL